MEPAKALAHFVRKYVQLEAFAAEFALIWPVPARSVTCVEFTFGEPDRIKHVDGSLVEIAHQATLIGAKTYQRVRLESRGRVESFAIFFQPTGLQRLFSLPGSAIVNEHYEAAAVLGNAMSRLGMHLAEAKSIHERVQIADAYFTKRIPCVYDHRTVDAAVQEIISRQGSVRISEFVAETGLGLRQFERLFVGDLGIPPKFYARIVRLEAALRKKAACSSINWTQIAYELGYHDQMHMIHDFQLLSGESPTSLAPHLDLLSSVAARPQA